MKVEAQGRFWKDLAVLSDKSLKAEILQFIDDAGESTIAALQASYDFKPRKGNAAYFRLRLDNYRLGCRYDRAQDTLLLMRLLHRRDIYNYFP